MAVANDIVNSQSVKVNIRVPHALHDAFPAGEHNTAYLLRCIAEEQERANRPRAKTRGYVVAKATSAPAAEIAPAKERKQTLRKAKVEEPAPKAKPGRKPKAVAAPEPVAEPVKPRRGRAPKAKLEAAPAPAPVKRARRVKVEAPAPAEPVKRGPGRPKKVVVAAPQPEPVAEPQRISRWKKPEKAKPGRKPKEKVEAA